MKNANPPSTLERVLHEIEYNNAQNIEQTPDKLCFSAVIFVHIMVQATQVPITILN